MTKLEIIWRRRTDDEVQVASQSLDEFTDEGKRVILAELERRRDRLDARRASYQLAIRELALGRTSGDVESQLVDQGLDSAAASIVVEDVCSAKEKARLDRAEQRIQSGVLFAAGGLAITMLSYILVSERDGYFVVHGHSVSTFRHACRRWLAFRTGFARRQA